MTELGAAYDADGVNATDLGESDLPADWAPSEFARTMDGFLMVADMLHPLVAGGYDANCIVMGADELGLKPMVEGVRERCPTDGTLHALYTRLIPGLDGYPKLSRRLPDSRFTLDDDPEDVRAAVRGDPDAPWTVDDDVVVEMMRLASAESAEQVTAWRHARHADEDAWRAARAAFANELAGYARDWQATAED